MSTFWGFSGAVALLTVELRRDAQARGDRAQQERENRAGLYVVWKSLPFGDGRGGVAMMHNTGKFKVTDVHVLDGGRLRLRDYPLPIQPGQQLPAFGDHYERTDPELTLYFKDARGQRYRRDPDSTLTPVDEYPSFEKWSPPATDEWGRPVPLLPGPRPDEPQSSSG